MELDSGCTSLHTGGITEIGASSVEGRDMKMKLKFAKCMVNIANGLLATNLKKLTREDRPKTRVRQLREY